MNYVTINSKFSVYFPLFLKEKLISHVSFFYPHESCGLIIGKREKNWVIHDLYPMRNYSELPQNNFVIGEDEFRMAYTKYGGNIIGIFHSHNDLPTPSITDLQNIINSKYLWMIIGQKNNEFKITSLYSECRSISSVCIHYLN